MQLSFKAFSPDLCAFSPAALLQKLLNSLEGPIEQRKEQFCQAFVAPPNHHQYELTPFDFAQHQLAWTTTLDAGLESLRSQGFSFPFIIHNAPCAPQGTLREQLGCIGIPCVDDTMTAEVLAVLGELFNGVALTVLSGGIDGRLFVLPASSDQCLIHRLQS